MGICGLVGHLVEDLVSVPVRFGIIHRCDGLHTVSDRVIFCVDEEKKCMLLVMRVLSIVPLNFKVRLHISLFTGPFGVSTTKIELPPTLA